MTKHLCDICEREINDKTRVSISMMLLNNKEVGVHLSEICSTCNDELYRVVSNAINFRKTAEKQSKEVTLNFQK